MDSDYVWGFSIIAGYVVIAYFVTRLINRLLVKFNFPFRKLSESLSYALFFGIGILSHGGGSSASGPGFGLPMPIFLAGFFGVWDWIPTDRFIKGIMIPFFFWWALFFLMVWVRNKSFQRKKAEI